MNQLFYTSRIENGFAYLDEEESRHLLSVMRRKVGDPLQITDGQGFFYETEISETEKSDRVKWSISESAGSENGPQAMRVRISCRDFVVFFGAGRTYNRREIFSMMGHCVRARRVVHNLRSGTGRMDSQLCRLLCSSTGD